MADAAEKRELGATIARAESASAEVVCSMRATNAAERGPGPLPSSRPRAGNRAFRFTALDIPPSMTIIGTTHTLLYILTVECKAYGSTSSVVR